MPESKRYLVIVAVRGPARGSEPGAKHYYREHVVATSPAKAAKIARARYVGGGGVSNNRVTTRVVD